MSIYWHSSILITSAKLAIEIHGSTDERKQRSIDKQGAVMGAEERTLRMGMKGSGREE